MQNKVLVELDALLDAILGTVAGYGQDHYEAVLSNDYINRSHNDISAFDPNIELSDFKERFENRNVDTLTKSNLTEMVFFIQKLLGQFHKEAATEPLIKSPKVAVNTHPYVLDEAEQDELRKILASFWGIGVTIELVHIPLKSLTPKMIKGHWTQVIMTNFNHWIADHHKALLETPIPTVEVIAPIIHLSDSKEEVDLSLIDEEDRGAFSKLTPEAALEAMLVEYVQLGLLPLKYFSVVGDIFEE